MSDEGRISDEDKIKDEEKVLDEVKNVPPLEHADNAIMYNISLQFCLSLCVLTLYFILRRKVKWLYAPNVQGKRSHPCYGYNGFFNWLIPVLSVGDTKLLILIGLDAFMMLQTLKFLFKIFLILALTVLPVMGYIYWHYFLFIGTPSNQITARLSIGTSTNFKNAYYLILLYGYLITLFIFYFIYIYYKRYTVLRQLYLRNPSILTSIITLKKLSKQFGSPELAAEYLSLSNRTLLVSNLPKFIKTDNDLKTFFEGMQVGEIESSVILHDTSILRNLYDKKNEAIENIEKEINQVVENMNSWSIKNANHCEETFQHFRESLKTSVDEAVLDEYVDADKKRRMLKIFANTDDNFKTYFYNREKALDYYFDLLKTFLEEIDGEKNRIKEVEALEDTDNIIEITEEQHALFIPGNIDQDASFFSLYHIFHLKRYWPYFSLDFPIGSKKGFVVFKNFKDASIVKQAKIGSKIFSVQAEDAPTPNDIIWENVNKGGVQAFVLKTCSNAAFFIFNVVFAYLAVKTINMVKVSKVEQIDLVERIFTSHPAIRDIYEGIVPALIYNLLLIIVPMIITALVNLEGIISYSKAQKLTMSRYLNFLFFNAFLSIFFATTIYSSLVLFIAGELTFMSFVTDLGEKILNSVTLFINTAIQKSLFGVSMLLLKPGPLIVNHFLRPLFTKKTRRQIDQSEFAPPFDFGAMFPDLLIVFPMLFSYTLIFPVVLIPGVFYFGMVYLFYKNDFLFSSRNHYESGGKYWEQAVSLIIYSVLAFQLATAAVIFFHSEKIIASLFIPLFYITFNFNSHLDDIFSKSCNCFPLNFQEGVYLDEFTEKLKHDRISLLETWDEESKHLDIDTISLDEIGYTDDQDVGNSSSFYRDPATSTSLTDLILPTNFFKMLFVLKKYDKGNFFGYKNSDL